ncbi:hypothetical protein BGZ60DRAFT_270355 [Tricladium varicosporioides]|nr:hypothetical protein BGZ60DRAFT_270355 [Hymenoscyphus varicosporioides]
MIVLTKKFFLVEWVIPAACTVEGWSVGLRGALPPGSKIYGVATTTSVQQDATVWVGRAAVTVTIDANFTPQSSFEMVTTRVSPLGGLPATWTEIKSGGPKFEQEAHIWLTTNLINSFFGDWVEGQAEVFKRSRLLNLDLWDEHQNKLRERELERDSNEE